MRKALIIARKEWRELVQQRMLVASLLIPAVFLVVLPIAGIYFARFLAADEDFATLMERFLSSGLTAVEAAQVLVGTQVSTFYVLFPGLLASIIASYSIVGEKSSRTLEPLLATPVRTWELLLGKCLASLVPGLGITWICGLLFIGSLPVMGVSEEAFWSIISPGWLIVFLLWVPLLSILSIAVMIAVSSRANDPRSAQQFSIWIIVPFLMLLLGQMAGLQVLGWYVSLAGALVFLLITVGVAWFVIRLFQREVILTRWK